MSQALLRMGLPQYHPRDCAIFQNEFQTVLLVQENNHRFDAMRLPNPECPLVLLRGLRYLSEIPLILQKRRYSGHGGTHTLCQQPTRALQQNTVRISNWDWAARGPLFFILSKVRSHPRGSTNARHEWLTMPCQHFAHISTRAPSSIT